MRYRASMWMRLRQVALVAGDLELSMQQIADQLSLGGAFHDKGVSEFGLGNAVWPIGRTFLEVVSPIEAGTAAQRYLDRRGGDGGYMIILQCDDVDAMRIRATEHGVPIVWKCDYADIRGTHFHPKFTGGAILSVDETVEPDAWRWAGPDWARNVRMGELLGIIAVDIQSDNPEALAARWAELLDKPVGLVGLDWVIALDEGVLRFVANSDDRGEGIVAIDLRAGASSHRRLGGTTQLCGVTFRFLA